MTNYVITCPDWYCNEVFTNCNKPCTLTIAITIIFSVRLLGIHNIFRGQVNRSAEVRLNLKYQPKTLST